jgi:hypothetical protein
MSDLATLIREQLASRAVTLGEVVEAIDDDDAASVVLRLEVWPDRAGDSSPSLCHEFALRFVGPAWEVSGYRQRWGLPGDDALGPAAGAAQAAPSV